MGSNNSRVFARPYSSHEYKQNGQIVSILFHDEIIRDLHSSKAKKIFDRYGIDNKCVKEHGIIDLEPKHGYTKMEVQVVPLEFKERGFRVISYSWTKGDARAEKWVTAHQSGDLSWHQFPNACIKLKLECTEEHNAGQLIPFELRYKMVDTNGQLHYINILDGKRELFEPHPSLPLWVWVDYRPPPILSIFSKPTMASVRVPFHVPGSPSS